MTVSIEQLRIAYKNPCRFATTANINLATTGLTAIDGVTPIAGDRVLVKDQTAATENGIYIASSGAWTRAADFDSASQDSLTGGVTIYVQLGDVNAKKTFILTTTGAITIGSTSLTFEESFVTGTVYSNAYFVGKHGDDNNDGKTPENAFLTIGQAITDINANETPSTSNRFEIRVLDAGVYSEGNTLPDWVSLIAPTATISGGASTALIVGDGCIVDVGRIETTTGIGISFDNNADEGWVRFKEGTNTTATNPFINLQNGTLYLTFDRLVVAGSGNAINVFGSNQGDLRINAKEIVVATGIGIRTGGTAAVGHTVTGYVGQITDTGSGTGLSISATGPSKADLQIGLIDCTTTYTVGTGDTLNLFVSDLVGSTGSVTGTANVVEASSASAATIGGNVGATDNRIVRTDGTGGTTIQGSGVTLNDNDNILDVNSLGITENGTVPVSPGAGNGLFWVQNTVPNIPMFTNDTDVDRPIVTNNGGSVDNALVRFHGTLGSAIQDGITSNNVILTDTGDLRPEVSDGGALGDTSFMWSDLFLASGSTINFNNGNLSITHSAGSLDIDGDLTMTSTTPEISLVGSSTNLIKMSNTGLGAPTTTTRSSGAKLVIWDSLDASNTDYAIGIENNAMWFGLPNATSKQFRWYAGASLIAELNQSKNFMPGTASTGNLGTSGRPWAGIYTDFMRVNGAFIIEEIASTSAPSAGFARVWVKNDIPNTLHFYDDGGTSWELAKELDDVTFHNITPETDNTYDLGSASLSWANLYLSSTIQHKSDLDIVYNNTDTTAIFRTDGELDLQINGMSSPFGGFGTILNGFQYSEDLTNAAWTKNTTGNDSTVIASNDTVAPNGQTTADKVTFSNAIDSGTRNILRYNITTNTNTAYFISFWAKKVSGDFTGINVDVGGLVSASTGAIDTTWKRYVLNLTTGGTDPSDWIDFNLLGHIAGTDDVLHLWGLQASLGSAGPYAMTNGTSFGDGPREGGVVNDTLYISSRDPGINDARIIFDNNGQIVTQSSGNLIFLQDSTETARLNSTSLQVTGYVHGNSGGGVAEAFRVGNDLTFWDINLADTAGLRGVADATRAQFRFGSSGTYVMGNEVGIRIDGDAGVEATTDRLEVDGDISTTGIVKAGEIQSSTNLILDTALNNDVLIQDNGATWLTLDSSANQLIFATSGTIAATGNVSLDPTTNNDVIILDGGSEWARFDSSVEALIIGTGTVSPGANVMLALEQNTANDCAIQLISDDGSSAWIFTDDDINDGLTFQSPDHMKFLTNGLNERMRIESGGRVNIGHINAAQGMLDIRSANTAAYLINTATATEKSVSWMEFSNDSIIETASYWCQFRANSGTFYGGIRGNNDATTVVYAQFAGHHDGYSPNTTINNGTINDGTRDWARGMILSSTGDRCTDGVNMAEEPQVTLSTAANDKTIVGIFQNAHTMSGSEMTGMDDNLPVIDYAAVGHAVVLVTDEDGEPNNGDLITTSGTIAGYGKKQADDIMRSSTVCKLTEQIDWSSVTETISGYKVALVACFVYCG